MRTILEAAAALRARKTSCVELTRACLSKIAALQPRLNAFVTVLEERALAQAAARDTELAAGKDRGPLHGIPIAVKDVFETKGIRTTCGAKLFADNIPTRDAAVVERLEAAGCVLLGKTGMHELAYGVTSTNPHFGAIRNPWNPDHIPGGSSGGSGAAVASGMAFIAMGSDTGGSIRIPAAFCGTVGLKPTYGRVSRYGVMPLDFSLDHMGPLTRGVRDAAVVLEALAGHDERDHTCSKRPVMPYVPGASPSLKGVRIGIPESFYYERADPGVEAAVRSIAHAAETLGAAVTPIAVPDIVGLNAVSRIILFAEASACMEPYWDRRSDIGPDVLSLIDQGRLLPATEYVQAQRLRLRFQMQFAEIFRSVDCLITPTTPNLAAKIGESTITLGGVTEDVRVASTRLVRGFNALGLPALALPAGVVSGLPASAQLIGPAFGEAAILRIAAAIEDATGCSNITPPGL
ncbi:MAG: Asp-tRNA(Asn)/Glu-tRNA(Gln) amidotransferase GatCAB subunit A [Candidatus Solibacter usitatus]|nr:Asp-tRNA(Asn)/Glu-tRNA(Gln) amidotransferase GatCAB subunit A [Candidatus Solibacter usitatus]